MKSGVCAILIGLLLLVPRARAEEPLQVLFIGNSYTNGNQLPKMVATLAAEAKGRPLETQQRTPGGTSFEYHWVGGKAVELIKSKKWDYVVLQNHSLGALDKRKEMFEFGKKLDGAVKEQGAKTILYMTWARQHAPENQDKITEAYETLGQETGAKVAPVGRAWQAAFRAQPDLVLHAKDKSHPTLAGTYLAACVFYSVIYDKSPVGLPAAKGVPADQAKFLQEIAWRVVQEEPAAAGTSKAAK